MEVHPPEHPILTWRQFFIHMGTITLGLLIALALEQAAEWAHHRHQLHVAEQNLQIELEANRTTLSKDEAELHESGRQLLGILHAIDLLRKHGHPTSMQAQWVWGDLQSSAWDTARNTGATAFMSYAQAQELADRYRQQELVNTQADSYIRGIYLVIVPFSGGKKPGDLTPAELDRMQQAVESALADLGHLQALCRGLDGEYK
jgi:hypothetical protein